MSRYKPKPIHSASWIEEHQPDKYTKQILAGEALIQKFLKKTNNEYFIIFRNGGLKNAYLSYQNDNGDLYYLYRFDWTKEKTKIIKNYPPEHVIIDIEASNSARYCINLEKLFSKSNNDWKIYYFDDEDSMRLFLEVTEGD